jgi:hypothetical protein
MQSVWFKGTKDKDSRTKEIKSYRNAYEELTKIIEMEWPEEIKPDFTKPGWEGDMAYQAGQRDAFRKIKNLINIGE